MVATLAVAQIPAKYSQVIVAPMFESNNDAWKIDHARTSTVLSVPAGKSGLGKPVWFQLPDPLTKGQHYRITLEWMPTTDNKLVNIHLRDGATAKFKVIGSVQLSGNAPLVRTDVFDFECQDASYSQIMLGAVHFTGGGASASIFQVKIDGIDASTVAVKKGGAATSDIAIPPNTPDRATIIANIMSDPKVMAWKEGLNKELPELAFYVAREMKEYANNKVGGPADILAFPKNIDELQKLVLFARSRFIPLTVLGRGSNIIVRDGGIRGIVLSTTKIDHVSINDNILTAGTGAGLIEVCYSLLDRGKSGLEWAAGIPGTIGGAVFMNAGTNVSDIRKSIRSVTVLTGDGKIETILMNDITWGKRYSTFQDRRDLIIVEAAFKIEDSPQSDLHKAMIRTVQVRENHFPLQNPNHGSTFKWWRAPRLISQAGLVGVKIGGAQVSEKQPGFIVNVNQASASDFEALINLIIARVYEFSGFMLEPEVEIIGERPHRYERYSLTDRADNLDKR